MARRALDIAAGLLEQVGHLATAALILGAALNLANIVGRYFLHASIPWAEEVMIYLMIGSVFFGGAQASLRGVHISMDILLRNLPRPLRLGIELVNDLLLIVVGVMIIWLAIPVISQLYDFDQRSEAARIPVFIPQMIVPVGFALMMLGTVLHRIRELTGAAGEVALAGE